MSLSFPFVAEQDFMWYGWSLVSSGHLPGHVLTHPIVHSQFIYWQSIVRDREGLDIIQQKPEHYCVISILLARNQRHSTIWASMKLHELCNFQTQYSIYLHTHTCAFTARSYLWGQWAVRKILNTWIRLMLIKHAHKEIMTLCHL